MQLSGNEFDIISITLSFSEIKIWRNTQLVKMNIEWGGKTNAKASSQYLSKSSTLTFILNGWLTKKLRVAEKIPNTRGDFKTMGGCF